MRCRVQSQDQWGTQETAPVMGELDVSQLAVRRSMQMQGAVLLLWCDGNP